MVDYNRYPAMDRDNNFPPPVRIAIANSEEIKNSVQELTTPLILEGIAAEGTVAGAASVAAANAVSLEVANRNLVEGNDSRLDVVIADDPTFEHVESDNDGNVIFGIRKDGSVYVRKLVGQDFLLGDDDRLPQELAVDIPGWISVEVDSIDQILTGVKSDGSIYVRELATTTNNSDSGNGSAESSLPMKIAGFGDSMLADHGGLGVSTMSELEVLSGVEVYKGGVPGQTSTEAALRQGGLDIYVNVAKLTIPATGAVDVTVQSPSGMWKTGSAWSFTGSLDGIEGTLSKSSTDTWQFTRSKSGSAKNVKSEIRWVSNVSKPSWINIFRIGRNNVNASVIKRDVFAMSKGLSGNNRRYLVLPLYNSSSEVQGTSQYLNVMAINSDHESSHGPNYYDLRGWLIRNGLTEAGIEPTSADLAAIEKDCIPPSLMHDNVHLNAIGRRVEAARILDIIKAKGWLV